MPLLRIKGDLTTSFSSRGDANVLTLSPEASIRFIQSYTIERPDLAANLAGIYSFLNIGRDGKARYSSMRTPRHLLTRRKNGCQWTPKGKLSTSLNEFATGAIEYNGEQCPDVFYEDCLNRMFLGTGNEVRDLLATEEGRAMFMEMMTKIYSGLGNSVYDLVTWANHPLITQSATNSWWQGKVSAEEWDDFLDQQVHKEVGGHMATLDKLASTDGLAHLNVTIQSNEVDGAEYVGDVIALFTRLVDAAPVDFATMIDNPGTQSRPVILVTKGIFNAYRDYLTATYNAIPNSYQILVQGEDGIVAPVRGMLMWNGMIVMKAGSWEPFYKTVGVTEHRAILAAPGVFGFAYDSREVETGQFQGIGLRVTQRTLPPYQGKVYMDTTFRMGAGIIDSDFVTMARYTITPE